MQYPYNMHQQMGPPHQQSMGGGQTTKREESFSSQATVFILKDKTWREQSQGLVQFVFDLTTYALRLIIAPGTPEEMDRRLRPRIRSKGPRAYVVRAQAPNNGEDSILAVRFEREEDSQNFRKFVEKRDADNTPNNTHQQNTNKSYTQQQQPPQQPMQQPHPQPYQQPYGNMYQNVNPGTMPQYGNQPQKYDGRGYDNYNYYPSPSPNGGYGGADYRSSSALANPSSTPHGSQSMYSQQYNPNINTNVPLVHQPQQSRGNSWNPSPNPVPGGYGGVEGHQDIYGNPSGGGPRGAPGPGPGDVVGAPGHVNQQQGNGGPQQDTNDYNRHSQKHYPSRSGQASGNVQNTNPEVPPPSATVLKLTEANLEQHNRVFAEISAANKRKNVRDIILEQLQWQREHGHGISAH